MQLFLCLQNRFRSWHLKHQNKNMLNDNKLVFRYPQGKKVHDQNVLFCWETAAIWAPWELKEEQNLLGTLLVRYNINWVIPLMTGLAVPNHLITNFFLILKCSSVGFTKSKRYENNLLTSLWSQQCHILQMFFVCYAWLWVCCILFAIF